MAKIPFWSIPVDEVVKKFKFIDKRFEVKRLPKKFWHKPARTASNPKSG